jgi:hypothetical protein
MSDQATPAPAMDTAKKARILEHLVDGFVEWVLRARSLEDQKAPGQCWPLTVPRRKLEELDSIFIEYVKWCYPTTYRELLSLDAPSPSA